MGLPLAESLPTPTSLSVYSGSEDTQLEEPVAALELGCVYSPLFSPDQGQEGQSRTGEQGPTGHDPRGQAAQGFQTMGHLSAPVCSLELDNIHLCSGNQLLNGQAGGRQVWRTFSPVLSAFQL